MEDSLHGIFHQILDAPGVLAAGSKKGANIPSGLNEFLSKIPGYLESCPNIVLSLNEDQASVILGRRQFLFWFLRRLSVLSRWGPSGPTHSHCHLIQSALLRLVLSRQPSLFKDLVQDYVRTLEACQEAGDVLDSDPSASHVQISPFNGDPAAQEPDFELQFEDALELETFQSQICKLLSGSTHGIVKYCPQLLERLWKVLCLQLEHCDFALKSESLTLCAHLILDHGFPISTSTSLLFYDCLFTLVTFLTGDAFKTELNAAERSTFQGALEYCLQEILNQGQSSRSEAIMLAEEIVACWSGILEKGLDILSQIEDSLVQVLLNFLSLGISIHGANKTKSDQSPALPLCLDFLSQASLRLGRDTLVSVSSCQINMILLEAEGKLKFAEKAKVARKPSHSKKPGKRSLEGPEKLPNPIEALPKLASLSPTWHGLTQNFSSLLSQNELSFDQVISFTEVAKGIFCKLQDKYSPISVLVDFLPRSLVGEIIQVMLQHVMSEPGKKTDYALCCTIVTNILFFQPIETLTQSLLQQMVALATMPWMSGEVKLQDLRIGDTLTHNMVKVSSTLRDDMDRDPLLQSVTLMSTPPKEVSPKWRLRVIRKAFSEDEVILRRMIISQMPIWMHNIGFSSHPLAKEIISEALASNEKSVLLDLAKISGSLLCLFAKTTSLSKKQANYEIFCSRCHGNRQLTGSDSDRMIPYQDVGDLFKLIGNNDDDIKVAILSLLRPMSNHVGVNETTVNLWIKYIEEMEDSPTLKFAIDIKVLFAPAVSLKQKPPTPTHPEEDPPPLKSSSHLVGWEAQDAVAKILLQSLSDLCDRAKATRSVEFLDTLCRSLVNVGSSRAPNVEEECTKLLMELIYSPITHVVTFNHAESFLRTKIAKYKSSMMIRLAEKMCASGSNPNVPLEFFMALFKSGHIRRLLNQYLHYLLPHLVLLSATKNIDGPQSPLEHLSSAMEMRSKHLIVENFQYIFPYVVMHTENSSEYSVCMKYIEMKTKVPLHHLLPSNRQKVINELLSCFHSHNRRVITAFQWLAKNDEDFELKGRPGKLTKSDIVAYILPKLLGILGYFDQKMNNEMVVYESKVAILESLHDLVLFMGSDAISTVKHKIVSTLRTASNVKSKESKLLLSILCRTWKAFLATMDISSIAPILSQVCANLWNIFELGCTDVVSLFKFLIIEHQTDLKDQFRFLHFIPEVMELVEINSLIRKHCGIDENTKFKEIINVLIIPLKNETAEVKALALKKLRHLFRMNQGRLQGLIVTNDLVDPMISRVIESLIQCSQDSDPVIVNFAGQCLGLIGALDPGRLERPDDLSGNMNISFSVFDEDFIYDLLRALSKAFLTAADSHDSDACAFTLQEVLRAYKITGPAPIATMGGKIWNRCSDSQQELLTPLLSSLYSRSHKDSSFLVPIYKSRENMTYLDWLSDWCHHLIGKVQDEKTRKVLTGCKAALKKDLQTAQFLIPYLVVTVVCQDNAKDTDEIVLEVETVINADESSSSSKSSPTVSLASSSSSKGRMASKEFERLASQTIFAILDHMNRWLRKKYRVMSASMKRSETAEKVKAKDKEYMAIDKLIQSIPQKTLALASFSCKSYARSLMHWESHIRQNPEELQTLFNTLQRVYGSLQETDYVRGIAAMRLKDPPLKELIHYHEAIGNYSDALSCYESIGKTGEKGVDLIKGMLRCYLEIDRPHTASILIEGLLEEKNKDESDDPEFTEMLHKYQLEASWQLSQWDKVESSVSFQTAEGEDAPSKEIWETGLVKLLCCLYSEDRMNFYKQLEISTNSEMPAITASAMEEGAFGRSYEHVVRLQMLNEIETIGELAFFNREQSPPSIEQLSDLFASWKTRTSYAQYSAGHLESVLKVRRAVLDIASSRFKNSTNIHDLLSKQLGEFWLLSAKVARKSGQLQKSYNLLLESEKFSGMELFIERSKLFWARGNQEEAISILRKGIADKFPWYKPEFDKKRIDKSELRVCGNAKLQMARYIDEAANLEAGSVPIFYNEARALSGPSEDNFYYCAKFFDKVIGKDYKTEDLDMKGDIIFHIIGSYVRSLMYGCTNILQSLPRLLSLWFDYGSRVVTKVNSKAASNTTKTRNDMIGSIKKMNDIIIKFHERCPVFYFLAVFPQLTSRICHSHEEVWRILKDIMVKSFIKFPSQCFWHMVALSKSSHEIRRSRCKEVFNLAIQKRPDLRPLIEDGLKLADVLQMLSDERIGPGAASLTQVMPSLPKLLSKKNFSAIMIPTTRNMSIVMPSAEGDKFNHSPFLSERPPHFFRVEDEITVMRSLVTPKKVTFIGSDGSKYPFLCKPKDDLRRDCRLIDFNILLNKLFMKDPECRKRDLRIRTYKVIPLNETSGLIEWINNITPMRIILSKLYREKCGPRLITDNEMREFQTRDDNPELNRKHYEILIERHPPVFAEWFVRNFPDPQTWFMARLGYTRTTAVMSMVGYLHGLGDRHAENILLDSSNGDTVHVDLNCLFNKGDDLKIPEVVPFRLTHNMVQAMGPTGFEGPFRIACEASLGLMRKQKDILMTALRPFYFDPLVDWVATGKQRGSKGENSEVVNEKAVETLKQIQKRLDGLVTAKKRTGKSSDINMPLSVVGQANFLIKEATSHDNLSQMYLGWCPYY